MAGQGNDDEHALVWEAGAVSEFLDALMALEDGGALDDPRRGLALKALYELHLDYSIANEYAAGVPERDKPDSDVAVHHLDVASPPALERVFQAAAAAVVAE
jgi:hypothetical protein